MQLNSTVKVKSYKSTNKAQYLDKHPKSSKCNGLAPKTPLKKEILRREKKKKQITCFRRQGL